MLSVRRTARHFAYGLLAAFNRYLLSPMDGFFYAIHKRLQRFRCRYVGWALIELESEEEYPPLVPPPDWMPPRHEDATQSIPNQIQVSPYNFDGWTIDRQQNAITSGSYTVPLPAGFCSDAEFNPEH